MLCPRGTSTLQVLGVFVIGVFVGYLCGICDVCIMCIGMYFPIVLFVMYWHAQYQCVIYETQHITP